MQKRFPRMFTFACAGTAVVLSGCAATPGPSDHDPATKGDQTGDGAGSGVTILPILVDEPTRSWAAAEPSAIDGLAIGEGRRFREVLARLIDELGAQGAPALAMAYGFPADAGDATGLLSDALDGYGAPVVLIAEPDADPRIYRDRLAGHGSAISVLVPVPTDDGVRIEARGFAIPLERGGTDALSTLALAAHLERAGLDAVEAVDSATAAASCASEAIPTGFTVEGGRAIPSGMERAVVLDHEQILDPVSALAVLQGRVAIPPAMVAILSDDTGRSDLLGDGVQREPAIGHAWAVAKLAAGEQCP